MILSFMNPELKTFEWWISGLRIFHSKVFSTELGTLKWDTFNPDCLIRISNVDTFDFLLNPLFFGYSREKSKTSFLKFLHVSAY